MLIKFFAYNVTDQSNRVIPLQRADKVKDLRVWFDRKLSFKDHIFF